VIQLQLAYLAGIFAPRRAGAQNPEDAVDCSPLSENRRATPAPIRVQRIE